MPTFAVELDTSMSGSVGVYKLYRDGKCLINEFTGEIKRDPNLKGELRVLFAYLEDLGQGKIVPPKKYKKLNGPNNLKYAPYEIKSSNLRLYLFRDESGQIVVIGGKKTNQDRDVKRFFKIIQEYGAQKNK